MHIKIQEIDSQQSDRATLNIDYNIDDEFVSLSINEGDQFDFNFDDLHRAINTVKRMQNPDSW